jgi:type II secretory pathway pseudopilin PulG
MTLIETMVAVAVLGIGSASLFSLLSGISTTNRRAKFQSTSLDVLAAISAQIRDAACDDTPLGVQDDPGLANLNTWTVAPAGSITVVGQLDAAASQFQTNFPMRVQYMVMPPAAPAVLGPRSVDVRVQICEWNHPSALGGATPGAQCVPSNEWIAGLYVREFVVKKVCAEREGATSRGEFY